MANNVTTKPRNNDHFSTAAKQIHAVLITLVFVIGMGWTACKSVYAANNVSSSATTSGVKWHPGHYYTLMGQGKNNPKYMAQVYRELKKTPALRGIQIRYDWAELEPAENMYDFTSIEHHLAELASQKKRLIILLQMKSFNPSTAFVPDYLKREDSIFPFRTFGEKDIKGYNLKLWNPLVHDRMVALISALGKRFNSHPYFEGIGLTETALGQPLEETPKNQLDNYYSNLLSINQQIRKYFPNTMTYQYTNYPRPMLKSFISKLREIGTGLGGPDIFMDDPGLIARESKNSAKGVYHHYPELSGIVPLTPSVMQTNYETTRHDKKGRAPSINELYFFARDNLKANYIFWTRAPKYYPQVLEMLNGLDQTGGAGGLNTTCPKAYPSCVD
jgi:hypothetical protein